MTNVNEIVITTADIATYTSCDTATKIEEGLIEKGTELVRIQKSNYRWCLVRLGDGTEVYVLDYALVVKPAEDVEENDGGENSENTGSENTGSENTGSENTGSENTGSENTGSENTGSENTGSENTGSENTESENTGN